jgi:hypothetical protein
LSAIQQVCRSLVARVTNLGEIKSVVLSVYDEPTKNLQQRIVDLMMDVRRKWLWIVVDCAPSFSYVSHSSNDLVTKHSRSYDGPMVIITLDSVWLCCKFIAHGSLIWWHGNGDRLLIQHTYDGNGYANWSIVVHVHHSLVILRTSLWQKRTRFVTKVRRLYGGIFCLSCDGREFFQTYDETMVRCK